MTADMPPSYYEAEDSIIADGMKEGATVHAGQFGSVILQFKDHYVECLGLACAKNPGVWQPRETFDGNKPDRVGMEGEIMFSTDRRKEAVALKNGWLVSTLDGINTFYKYH